VDMDEKRSGPGAGESGGRDETLMDPDCSTSIGEVTRGVMGSDLSGPSTLPPQWALVPNYQSFCAAAARILDMCESGEKLRGAAVATWIGLEADLGRIAKQAALN
jgi:hypothetical protein